MPPTIPRRLCVPVLLVLTGACTSSPAPKAAAPAPSKLAAAVVVPAAKPVELPKVAVAPALVLKPQPGWVVEQPSSAMRKAQFSLPHGAESSEDASLVVYYFGGQGGSREANLDRWAAQFEQADNSSSIDALKSSTRKVAGLEVFEATLSGRYVAETAPGSGEHLDKPGWRMIASIVDASDGPWYFKLVGPEATVAKWEASYEAYLNSMEPRR